MRVPAPPPEVAAVFEAVPPAPRKMLKALRKLIYATAARTPDAGALKETLKWGEPAYLTAETGSGTTIRLGWKPAFPERVGLYVHCQTNLVDRYRSRFADQLTFDGDRGILFDVGTPLPEDEAAACIAEALTYHSAKNARRTAPAA